MERELNIQIPRWQPMQEVCLDGGAMSGRLSRTDALGRAGSVRTSVYPQQSREQALQTCQLLDMAQMLLGCANIVCHQDHWARQTDGNWEVCVQEADLPDLNDFCARRASHMEELIVLPTNPEQARQALEQYKEKQRIPEQTVIEIGKSICQALEQCREKGLETCAVTMQTVRVTPYGSFVLTGLGLAAEDRPTGTCGLGQVMCHLLGGENGKCAFGEEKLRTLVEQACNQEMDAKDLWAALDRMVNGVPEVEKQREQILQLKAELLQQKKDTVQLQEKLIAYLQAQQSKQETKPALAKEEKTAESASEPWNPEKEALLSKLAAQLAGQAKQKEEAENKQEKAVTWTPAGDLVQKGPAPAAPLLPHKDYTAVIRQKMALTAVVSAGDEHSVALLNNGKAVATGKNINQQCNVGSWRGLQAVSAGDGHTVGLTTEGRVVATGNNGYGQCAVGSWQDIVQVCAGYFHTVGLKSDGTVVSAGKKENFRCEVSGWKDIVAIAVGVDHTVGLRSDGTVVATGSNKYGQCNVSSWQDIVSVCAGAGHTVGLKSDGTVVAVGWEHNNKCAVGDWKDIIAISAGIVHTVGLKYDGTVVAVGNTGAGRCDVSGWKDVAAISAGKDHTVAVCVDGTMLTTGSNALGQCNIGKEKNVCVPGVRLQPPKESLRKDFGKDYTMAIRKNAERNVSISAGYAFSACVLENGNTQSTGSQVNIRPWRAVQAVAAGADFCVGLRVNGKVLAEGGNAYGQCNVGKWDNIIQVAVGEGHTVGLRSDGTVIATGKNDKGQCNVAHWKGIIAIAAGYSHTLGLKKDGTVVAMGDNGSGQCAVAMWQDIVCISAGEAYTVGLRADGTAVAVGSNKAGQCDVSGWKDLLAVDAGKDHTIGLKKDGTVVAVGRTAFNQCAVSRWKNIVAISAGQCYTLGLRADGSVVSTGLNTNGQCRVTTWRKVKVPIQK